jgi:hypothetical protein
MIERQIESPMPMPPDLVVKNALNSVGSGLRQGGERVGVFKSPIVIRGVVEAFILQDQRHSAPPAVD